MSKLSTVDALVAKKKAEGKASAPNPTEPKEMQPEIDSSQFPVLKNTVSYEEIVGEKHPDGKKRMYPVQTVDWEHPEDIPEADPLWVPDHSTLPLTLSMVCHGHNGVIVGEPGTGKTKDIREIAARIKKPYYRFSGMDGLEPADFLGQNQIIGGQTKYVDGAIMRCVRHGGLWAYDEPFKTPPGTNMCLQWLAEPKSSGRSVMLYGHEDEKEIKVEAHPEFQMILCDNARGSGDNMDLYAATNVQDQSFINRMQYKIRKTYMRPDDEQRAIMTAYPWILSPLAKKMTSFAKIMRLAWNNGSIEIPFSFRELQSWSEAIAEFDGQVLPALNAVYGNILEQGEEQEIYHKAITDCAIR